MDPDDRLVDVVDDREQLVACLTGTEVDSGAAAAAASAAAAALLLSGPRMGLGLRGDGTSASSNSGSPSPDFMHRASRKDIEVTGEEAAASDLLQVRRGSEPALNRISPGPNSNLHPRECNPREYKVRLSVVFHFLSSCFGYSSLVAFLFGIRKRKR